jgi:hypothetical protein
MRLTRLANLAPFHHAAVARRQGRELLYAPGGKEERGQIGE